MNQGSQFFTSQNFICSLHQIKKCKKEQLKQRCFQYGKINSLLLVYRDFKY